jgi:predicted Fe-Mo cluster-binding NifX family protein
MAMNSLAMMVSRDSLDAHLARTFGKAKWLLLWDGTTGGVFRRNETLSGGSVAGAIAASGCRDVIAAHFGEKACAHLSALGVRLWKGPADAPVRDVIEMHLRGELSPWNSEVAGGSGGCTSNSRGHAKHAHREHGTESPAPVVQLRRRGPRD